MSEPIFTAHDGNVFYRGVYHTPESCERLLLILLSDPWLPDLAQQLAIAMREAGQLQQERNAA